MITGINHVQITIPTGAETDARGFYCDFLGLTEVPKPDSLAGRGGFWMMAGKTPIHVGTGDDVQRTSTKAHIAYEVTNLQAWREKLSAHGIKILEGIPIPGHDRFEFRDPFGNRVEMVEVLPG